MATSWQDNSEIVLGLILENRLSLNLVRPEMFFPPYDEVIKLLKKGVVAPEDLIEKVGLSPIQAAHEASKTLNGLGDMNWTQILEHSYVLYEAGTKFEKLSGKLKKGEDIDWAIVNEYSSRAQKGIAGDFTPLSEVEGSQIPFIPSGWKAVDDHLGGLPSVGLIVVGGNPGIGKTTWVSQLSSRFVRHHANKKVAFFSLEMVLQEIGLRFREVEKLNKEEESRILLNDHPVSPEEAINKASTIENLGLVIIDFADLMIKGDNSESSYAHIYKTLSLGSKLLGCPVVLLAQLVKSITSLPKPSSLRYTKLAEAMAWMILMLYDPSKDWNDDDNDSPLPIKDNTAYVICWKCRGGFRKHLEDSPGAIMMPFRGDKGWGLDKSKWFSLKKE